eukprot:5763256-Prymnesium_polylepis.1
MLSFNMRTSEGFDQEVLINRYENVFVADEKYKRCCGRLMGPLRNHAPTCWTQRPNKGPEDAAGLAKQPAGGGRDGRGGRAAAGR